MVKLRANPYSRLHWLQAAELLNLLVASRQAAQPTGCKPHDYLPVRRDFKALRPKRTFAGPGAKFPCLFKSAKISSKRFSDACCKAFNAALWQDPNVQQGTINGCTPNAVRTWCPDNGLSATAWPSAACVARWLAACCLCCCCCCLCCSMASCCCCSYPRSPPLHASRAWLKAVNRSSNNNVNPMQV